MNRRHFSAIAMSLPVGASWQISTAQQTLRQSQAKDHHATGTQAAATSTSKQATEAALWALQNGGNAADAYLAAALTQTVVEPGLTSIGGALGMTYFDAKTGKTSSCIGKLGPAADEPYDFDRKSPITQTGRAMPVPGFIAGVHVAHSNYASLPWKKLFEPPIKHAIEGADISPLIIQAAQKRGAKFPEGKELWIQKGEFLKPKQRLKQPRLAKVLQSTATGGPEAFYEGDFARNYIKRAAADGGKVSLQDFADWKKLTALREGNKPEGNYRGYQVWAPGAGLITYALHLNEALDLRSTGISRTNPESVYRQVRIMEELFLSTKDYSSETHTKYVSKDYALERSKLVIDNPIREVTLDAIFNTCFLVVRDSLGNCAWGTHSINTPSSFGAGILVDGVYAAYAINRDHVRGKGATASGISTSYALYKEGRPEIIIGSPGYGFVHGPYQYGTGIVEWELRAPQAMNLPRFSLQNANGVSYFESHYDSSVFEMLKEKGVKHRVGRPSTSTGLVGALLMNEEEKIVTVQDGRRDGWARAF